MSVMKKWLIICVCFCMVFLSGCGDSQKYIGEKREFSKPQEWYQIVNEAGYFAEAIEISSRELDIKIHMNPELGRLTEILTEDEHIREEKEYIEKVFLEAFTVPGQAEKYFHKDDLDLIYEIKLDSYYNRARCFFIRHCDIGDELFNGYVILDNESDSWEEKSGKKIIFIDFEYFPFGSDETGRKWYIDEVVESDKGIVNYEMGPLDEEGNITDYAGDYKWGIVQENVIRLLDKDVELNKEFQVKRGLKDEKLVQYTEAIFLDICRYPENIVKYESVLNKEFLRVFKKMPWFYKQPEGIYDIACGDVYRMEEDGSVVGATYISSQYRGAIWQDTYILSINIDWIYDADSGRIEVVYFHPVVTIR